MAVCLDSFSALSLFCEMEKVENIDLDFEVLLWCLFYMHQYIGFCTGGAVVVPLYKEIDHPTLKTRLT